MSDDEKVKQTHFKINPDEIEEGVCKIIENEGVKFSVCKEDGKLKVKPIEDDESDE